MINKIPELKDIEEMVCRYNGAHKEGIFIFQFLGFKKDPNHQCEDCGDNCDVIDETKSLIGIHGDIESIRTLLNELRDIAEDNIDEEGFININEFGEDEGEEDGQED
jgi:hypothetical protein